MPAWPELAAIYRAPTLSLTEAVEGGSNLVIVGAAGSGKTVALAHLASQAANLQVRLNTTTEVEAVPYLYHVADLQLPFDPSRDPINVIVNLASEHAPMFDLRRLPGFIQQTFRNGQALVLIDGFDELDPQSQRDVVDWFKALICSLSQCADRDNRLCRPVEWIDLHRLQSARADWLGLANKYAFHSTMGRILVPDAHNGNQVPDRKQSG
jgi:hypothetical protein